MPGDNYSGLENLFEIETEIILEEYSQEDIKEFVYDLFLVFDVLQKIDKDYGKIDNPHTEKDIKKFKRLIKDWNAKYRDIILEFHIENLQCKLSLYIKEKNYSSVSKTIELMKRFVSIVLKEPDTIEGVFRDNEHNTENTLTLKKEKSMLRLIYAKEDMLKPKSPEFRICAYYALKGGYDKTINLQKYAEEFSFQLSSEKALEEEHGWESRYPNINFGKM